MVSATRVWTEGLEETSAWRRWKRGVLGEEEEEEEECLLGMALSSAMRDSARDLLEE
jgi:hypothetical protein